MTLRTTPAPRPAAHSGCSCGDSMSPYAASASRTLQPQAEGATPQYSSPVTFLRLLRPLPSCSVTVTVKSSECTGTQPGVARLSITEGQSISLHSGLTCTILQAHLLHPSSLPNIAWRSRQAINLLRCGIPMEIARSEESMGRLQAEARQGCNRDRNARLPCNAHIRT